MTTGDPYRRFRAGFIGLLDPCLYTAEWLDECVATGSLRVFGNENACILVSLKEYPTGALEIHGEAAVGDLQEIKRLIEDACEWGRQIGCSLASIASREGWARALKDDGWSLHQVMIRKEL